MFNYRGRGVSNGLAALPLALALISCGQGDGAKVDAVASPDTDSRIVAPDATDTPDLNGSAPIPQAAPSPAASVSLTPISCETQRGKAAAQKLADQCIQVSGATHPPCNIANSCAMIADEVARNCDNATLDGPRPAACGPVKPDAMQAVATLRRYYDAINAHDFATAYAQWGNEGQASGKSLDAFGQGFSHTLSASVTIGKADDVEGAAGSLYITLPVTIDARLDSGKHQRFTGSYVLRRVNNVDGASVELLQWHLQSANLKAQ